MKKLTNKDLANLLKNNVEEFNKYRDSFPNQKIDFTQLDKAINFKHSSLNHANLSNMNLEGLNFEDSNMCKVQLIESNISNCNFSRCYLNKSDLRGVKAQNTCFKYAESEHCDYRGADVELSKFDNSILHDSDFRGSNLTRKQMLKAQCSKREGWSDGSPDYVQTIKTDSAYWSDETYSGEISELFVPFFIVIFFAILIFFVFGSIT